MKSHNEILPVKLLNMLYKRIKRIILILIRKVYISKVIINHYKNFILLYDF
jgi:hypothetical protein